MEAKHTVITLCNHPYHNRECHKDQAEVSFKGGELKGRQAGIKEVVEWIHLWHRDVEIMIEWQKQLKEWGV